MGKANAKKKSKVALLTELSTVNKKLRKKNISDTQRTELEMKASRIKSKIK